METVNNLAKILRRNARRYALWDIKWVGKPHNNVSALEYGDISLHKNIAHAIAQQLK